MTLCYEGDSITDKNVGIAGNLVNRKEPAVIASPRRTRRSAEDARAQIIAAARARIAEGGPGALRLQDVAADVGVSHPTLLQHFGSREGLLREVQAHSVGIMRDALLACLAAGGDDNAGLVTAVFEAFRGGGVRTACVVEPIEGVSPSRCIAF